MLDEELRKLVTQYPELNINDIYKNKPYPEKLSSKISNIIFSQLMTMISNILMFTNNNMFAIELIESLKEKYIYKLVEENAHKIITIYEALFVQYFSNREA